MRGNQPKLGISPMHGIQPTLGNPSMHGIQPALDNPSMQGSQPKLGSSPTHGTQPTLGNPSMHGIQPTLGDPSTQGNQSKLGSSPMHGIQSTLGNPSMHGIQPTLDNQPIPLPVSDREQGGTPVDPCNPLPLLTNSKLISFNFKKSLLNDDVNIIASTIKNMGEKFDFEPIKEIRSREINYFSAQTMQRNLR
jgi:hypothetical protein